MAPTFLLFKSWVYCQFTTTNNITPDLALFFGIFMENFIKTFLIDMIVFVCACLLAGWYYVQLHHLEARNSMSQGHFKC
jgi:hypothetical protein